MIMITFLYDKEKNICGFKTKGHAGYAESGKDIICSAVSMLTMNTVNSMEQLTEDDFNLEMNEKKGILDLKIKDKPSMEAMLLLNSMKLGIDMIHNQYGDKYIRIESKEV